MLPLRYIWLDSRRLLSPVLPQSSSESFVARCGRLILSFYVEENNSQSIRQVPIHATPPYAFERPWMMWGVASRFAHSSVTLFEPLLWGINYYCTMMKETLLRGEISSSSPLTTDDEAQFHSFHYSHSFTLALFLFSPFWGALWFLHSTCWTSQFLF